MPGYTHLQVAQPVSFGHHLLAYFEMLARDAQRFADCRKRVNRLPLGAAALAGTSFPIDRQMVAKELGFDGVCENSIDAVSDRDFAIEFCAGAALAMTHLSRFCEELILWMNPRFGFVDARRPLLHRLLDHAAEEEPGRGGADPRQDRARQRPPGGAAHAHERAAARLQPRQPGGQGAAVRHGGHADGVPRRVRGDAAAASRSTARRWRPPRGRDTPPPPISPSTW